MGLLKVTGGFCLLAFFIVSCRTEIPNCDFMDTVNITDSHKFSNGSYLYENVVIPPNLTATYSYDIINGGEKIRVPVHLRGCVCKLRSCVKFCCHPDQMIESMECTTEFKQDLTYSPFIDVTLNNGSRQLVHVLDEFVVQKGNFCPIGFTLHPASEDDRWELFENGTFLRLYDKAYLGKGEYCLTPLVVDDKYVLSPYNCAVIKPTSIKHHLNRVGMLISIPFIVLTIVVYLLVPQLRNLHGMCLVCYLIGLVLGYSMLVVMSFESSLGGYSLSVCGAIAYICYYSFMSAFLWLSVISFDLWNSFSAMVSGVKRFTHRRAFPIFSLYAWGIPIIMVMLVFWAQNSNMNDTLKPGFGELYCWFDTEKWSPMLYFYGPILIIMLFNMTMFILTAIKIRKVQAESMERKRLSSHKHNVSLYLRLFIVMGVTWLLEVFSYMVGNDNIWSYLFWVADILNASQGLIIFVLFVLRKKVRNIILKRDINISRSNSTQSQLAPEEMTLREIEHRSEVPNRK